MAYHPLTNETGGDEDSRVTEAHKLCEMLDEFVASGQVTDRERGFIEQMADCTSCSPKQLFYLRDIKDKYL